MRSAAYTTGNRALAAGLAALAVLCLPALAADEPDRELRVTVVPRLETLEASATLRLADMGPDNPSLELGPALDVVATLIDGHEARFELHERDGRRVVTFLHERALAGPHHYTLRYAGRLQAPGVIRPDGVYLAPQSRWYPELPGLDRPVSRSLELELPVGWEAAAGGAPASREEVGDSVISTFASEVPTHELHVVAGPLARSERDVVLQPPASAAASVVRVAALLDPRDGNLATPCIESALRYLQRYAARFGAYPYPSFSIVATPLGAGDGVPGVALLPRAELTRPVARDAAIGHQAAHAWWGGTVAVADGGGDWSEALAAYVAEYGERAAAGEEAAAELRGELLRSYTAVGGARGNDLPLERIDRRSSPAAARVGRAKGVMVFHMLEQRLGSRRFDEALSRLYLSARQRPIDWNVLRAAFSASAGEDLTWFFQQWVRGAGAPELALADVESVPTAPGAGSFELRGTLLQTGGPWRLRLPLVVADSHRSERRTIDFDAERARFRFTVPFRPERLTVDPGFDVLRRLGRAEQVPLAAHALSDPRTLLVIEDRAGKSEVAAYRELAKVLSSAGPLETVDASRATAAGLEHRSLVLLGLPLGEPTESLIGALPAEVELQYEGFGIGEGRFRDPRSALLVAGRHPDDPSRTLVLFWGLSPRAIRQAGPNVLKNSEFSWVAFIDGTPGQAGVSSVGAGPLEHRFSGNPKDGNLVEQE